MCQDTIAPHLDFAVCANLNLPTSSYALMGTQTDTYVYCLVCSVHHILQVHLSHVQNAIEIVEAARTEVRIDLFSQWVTLWLGSWILHIITTARYVPILV